MGMEHLAGVYVSRKVQVSYNTILTIFK